MQYIAASLGIEPSDNLRSDIDRALASYFALEAGYSDTPKESAVTDHIAVVHSKAKGLADALRALSDYHPNNSPAEQALNSATMDALLAAPAILDNAFGPAPGSDVPVEDFVGHEFDGLLAMLDKMVSEFQELVTARKANPDKGGPTGSPALNDLIVMLATRFKAHMGREAGITWNAYERRFEGKFLAFVQAVIRPLEPENSIPVSALGRRIKRVLTDNRENGVEPPGT